MSPSIILSKVDPGTLYWVMQTVPLRAVMGLQQPLGRGTFSLFSQKPHIG